MSVSRYHFHQLADTVGDGSGTDDFIGDFTTPEEGLIIPKAGEIIEIHRMIVYIEDVGAGGFKAETYGALSALSNGVTVKTFVSAGADQITDYTPTPVTNNAQWGAMCFDVDVKTWGAGAEMLLARYTFVRAGEPITLTEDERIVVGFSDNLTGLVHHQFHFQGHYLQGPT